MPWPESSCTGVAPESALAEFPGPRRSMKGRLHVVGGGEQPGLFVSGAHEAFHL